MANRATLEFVLLTKKSSPERGRTHGFRVSTCAAALWHLHPNPNFNPNPNPDPNQARRVRALDDGSAAVARRAPTGDLILHRRQARLFGGDKLKAMVASVHEEGRRSSDLSVHDLVSLRVATLTGCHPGYGAWGTG